MFCSNCGNELLEKANFCSTCGQKVSHESFSMASMEERNEEIHTFSSNFILGGSLLTPERLIINEEGIIYRKRNKNLIGVDELVLPFRKISSIKLDRKLITTTILIYTYGNEIVELPKFTIADAKQIRDIISVRINQH